MLRKIFILVSVAMLATACTSTDATTETTPEPIVGDVFDPAKTDVLDVFTSETAKTPQTIGAIGYDSITLISDDAVGKPTAIGVTLPSLTLSLEDDINYERGSTATLWSDSANLKIDRTVVATRITSSGVKLTFGDDGSISAVTAYADGDYDNATADRSTAFGFDSEYMVYVSWASESSLDDASEALKQNVNSLGGMMIAGIETVGTALTALTNDSVMFKGAGTGIYGNGAVKYNTSFATTATADFTAKTLEVSTSGTACLGDNCTDVAVPTYLNFMASGLKFLENGVGPDAANNIFESLVINSNLTGSVEARFYGGGAEELGGTFYAGNVSAQEYYMGAFGARVGTSDSTGGGTDPGTGGGTDPGTGGGTDPIVNTITLANNDIATNGAPAMEHAGYDSLDAALAGAVAGTDVTLNLSALAVQSAGSFKYMRSDAGTDWVEGDLTGEETVISNFGSPIISITYQYDVFGAEEGSLAGLPNNNVKSVTPYLGVNAYASTSNEVPFGNLYVGAIDSVASAGKTSVVVASQDIASSTDTDIVESQYMMLLNWINQIGAEDMSTDLASETGTDATLPTFEQGYLVAGIETAGTTLATITDTAVSFKGAGSGNYKKEDGDDFFGVDFDVSATVNFTAYTVGLTTTNTGYYCYGEAGCTDVMTTNLNFTAALTYSAGANNISGTVATDGMSGSANARFYGPMADELGGTFRMSSATEYYMGAFGAKVVMSDSTGGGVIGVPEVSFDAISDAAEDGTDRVVTFQSLAVEANSNVDLTRVVEVEDAVTAAYAVVQADGVAITHSGSTTIYKVKSEGINTPETSDDAYEYVARVGTTQDLELYVLTAGGGTSTTADDVYEKSYKDVSWWNTPSADITVNSANTSFANITNPTIAITYKNGSYLDNSSATVTTGLLDKAVITFADGSDTVTHTLASAGADKSTEFFLDGGGIVGDETGYIEVSRGVEAFGFTSKYMVGARWSMISNIMWLDAPTHAPDGTLYTTDNQTGIAYQNKRREMTGTVTNGLSVSGFETGKELTIDGSAITIGDLPITGTAMFAGKGVGYYANGVGTLNDALQLTEFDVAVTADFVSSSVAITTTETKGYSCNLLETRCDSAIRTPLNNLNITTGDISYTTNSISKTDLTVDGMSGNIEARFYGPDVEEFGGTFNVSSGTTKYYMGYFGAEKK